MTEPQKLLILTAIVLFMFSALAWTIYTIEDLREQKEYQRNYVIGYAPHFSPRDLVSEATARIIACESQWRFGEWGDLDLEEPVYGVCQFQEDTFYWLADLSGYSEYEWKNDLHQLVIMEWAVQNGYGKLWSCY